MSPSRGAARLAALRLAGPPLARFGRLASRRSPWGRPPRLLLIRPDHLGDVLLAGPAAAILRDALPNAEIDWLVGSWSASIAQRAGSLDGVGVVRTLDFPGFTRQPKRSPLEPYAVLWREAAKLRALDYDAALILRPDHWWGALLAALAGIPRRFGYAQAECAPFLTDTLPTPAGPHRHVVRTNQALARLAGSRLSGRPPVRRLADPAFPILPGELAWAQTWLSANVSGLAEESPLVALHPGSGAVLKNWLPERWAAVLTALRAQCQARVFLTGGPGDRAVVEAIAARLEPRPPALVGATSLGQLAAVFACSDLVLGCDSGPLHLAAAVGTCTVRLYGPTDPAEFGPWSPAGQSERHRAVEAAGCPLLVQPCRHLVAPPCAASEAPGCMQAIGVSAVCDAIRDVLGAGRPDLGQRAASVARSVEQC